MKKNFLVFILIISFTTIFSDYLIITKHQELNFDIYYSFDNLFIGKSKEYINDEKILFIKEFREDKKYFILKNYGFFKKPADVIFFDFEKNIFLVETSTDFYKKENGFEMVRLDFKKPMNRMILFSNDMIPEIDFKRFTLKNVGELDSIIMGVSSDSLYNTVATLSGEYPYPQGTYSKSRVMVTPWLDTAFVYLYDRMVGTGVDTVFSQPFYVSSYYVKNVVGLKRGILSSDTCIVVGAHYDDYSNDKYIAPGADDNGSGSAAVLELARLFSSYPTDYDIYFVLFTAEEYGLYGSEYFVYNFIIPENKYVLGMLNYDMIGYNPSTDYKLMLYGMSHSNPLKNLFKQACDSFTNINAIVGGSSSGSDHYFFDIEGFKTTFAIEYTFSPVYHSTRDSISYLNFDYMKEVVKGGAATLYFLKNMPVPVSSITLKDKGDSSVIVSWEKVINSDIAAYKIYYRKDGDSLESYIITPDTNEYTISSLIPQNLYYFKIAPINLKGFEGFTDIIDTITPSFIPNGITLNKIYSDKNFIYIHFQKTKSLDFSHYNIYRRRTGETGFSLIKTLTDTFFVDSSVSDTSIYVYAVTVSDITSFESEKSNADSTRLIKLSKDFLVIDETSNNQTITDIITDATYDTILGNFIYDVIDMDSLNRSNNIQFGNYKSILYIDDDMSLNKIDFEDLSRYVENGGKIFIVGWDIGKPITGNPLVFPVYPGTSSIAYKMFKISKYDRNQNADLKMIIYNIFGVQDSIKFNEDKLPRGSNGNLIYGDMFELNSVCNIFGRYISATGDTTFNLKNILYSTEDTSVIVLGAPLYYMETDDANRLVKNILNLWNIQMGVDDKKSSLTLDPHIALKYSKDKLILKYTGLISGKNYSLKIFDLSGRIVKEKEFKVEKGTDEKIFSFNLKNGIYFVLMDGFNLSVKISVIK